MTPSHRNNNRSRLEALYNQSFSLIDTLANANIPVRNIHLWDVCCDHGYLGEMFLKGGFDGHVHFVDQVKSITHQLQHRLDKKDYTNYSIHCQDAAFIHLDNNKTHIIVIAGVGGELTIKIIQNILKNNPHCNQDNLFFQLCPNYYIYDVRSLLHDHQFIIIDEMLILERKHHYEIMLCGKHYLFDAGNIISKTGDFWHPFTDNTQKYLNKLLHHYKKKSKANKNQATKAAIILKAYQDINKLD